MCDYGDYEPMEFSRYKEVAVRRSRRCHECHQRFPIGTRMVYYCGVWGGEFGQSYYCRTCWYMCSQPESSPFHACMSSDDPNLAPWMPAWREVTRAFDRGEKPNPDNVHFVNAAEESRLRRMWQDPSPLVFSHD